MISVPPNQMAWLKSIVRDGPTAYCTTIAKFGLVRKGLARDNAESKLEATDLGRQVIAAEAGDASTLTRVK